MTCAKRSATARYTWRLLFASAHFEEEYTRLTGDMYDHLGPQAFIGTSAEVVACDQQELESRPAVALWAAHMPGGRVKAFHLSADDVAVHDHPERIREYLDVPADEGPSFVLLADPFTCGPGALELLNRLEVAYPGRSVIGGMASAAERPGQNLLAFEGQALRSGLVGVAVWGNARIDTVVSQGCRPIGRPLVVTQAERNIIQQLDEEPALSRLIEVLRTCRQRDIELARTRGVLVGRVIDDRREQPHDFLIRNPIDSDQESGTLAINDVVRAGQTLQFHVRDEESASEELTALLAQGAPPRPAGALLFSCNGRGTRLFSCAHHDTRAIADQCGALPVAGMFCQGEIGPIGERNFLHGHTASIGFFRPAES